jgi:hypothetical protein
MEVLKVITMASELPIVDIVAGWTTAVGTGGVDTLHEPMISNMAVTKKPEYNPLTNLITTSCRYLTFFYFLSSCPVSINVIYH